MSLSFPTLKRLSFAHSTIYTCLLIVWLVPGLATEEMIFGFTHGVGWICMVILIFAALRARVVPMRTAFAVSVLGGIAPFFGSYEFVREERRRAALGDGPGTRRPPSVERPSASAAAAPPPVPRAR